MMIPSELPKRLVAAKTEAAVILILNEYTATLAGMIAAAEAESMAAAHLRTTPGPIPPEGRKYHVPGPYEIALALGCALASTGRFETPGGALTAAWMAIPEFYAARDAYLRDMAPMMLGVKPPGEPDERASQAD